MPETRPLSTEEALLWACATSCNDEAAHAAIEQALDTSQIDWPACARMSVRHGIAPLLAYHLQAFTGHPRVPADVSNCFARLLEANGRRNRVLFRECARLIRAFEAAGIRSLILKGVGLALAVYPQPALRNFADIDLWVEAADLQAAGAAARRLGFIPAHEEIDAHLLHQTFVTCCPEDILTETLPLEYELELSREVVERHKNRVVVEIHQGLFRDVSGIARRVDDGPLRQSPRSVRLPDGTEGLLPSPDVMLVHLASHAAGHGFARLMFFVDLALVLRHWGQEVDWNLVNDLAARYEVSSHVYRCLEFVRREFGVHVPRALTGSVSTPEIKRSFRPLQRSMIFAAEREFGSGVVLQGLLLSQTPRQFCVALRNILFPPPVIMRRYYRVRHPLAVAMFYIWRPILLSGHLAQVLFRRVRRRR